MTTDNALVDDEARQVLFEMANPRLERTGLPFVVFISRKDGARDDVRVKIARSPRVWLENMATVVVRPVPRIVGGEIDGREFALLARWIELNRDVLVRYWNGEIEYTEDAIAAIRPFDDSDASSR